MANSIVLFLLSSLFALTLANVKVLHSWRYVDYDFPSDQYRQTQIQSGAYIPANPVPIDVDVWRKNGKEKTFVTVPRFKDGVPASLTTVSDSMDGSGPRLKPYPNWSWHNPATCENTMTSVFRTQIDKCDRLWVIDSGMVDLFKFPRKRQCQPKVLAFTPENDQLVGRYEFPDIVLQIDSVLTTIAVDVRDSCQDAFVYVTDVTGFAMVVLDVQRKKSWRVQSNNMFPYPPYGHFKSNNVEFDLMDGVLAISLGPIHQEDRTVYYHPFASLVEGSVLASVLRNDTLFPPGLNLATGAFKTSIEARPSQAAVEVFDKNGVMYFAPVGHNAIACWNSDRPYTPHNIHQLIRDDANLQFATSLKISEDKGKEDLYLLTNRFQLVMVGQMKIEDVNFRIVKSHLSELTAGSQCVGKTNGKPIHFPTKYGPYGGHINRG